jgi:hypothetical protein
LGVSANIVDSAQDAARCTGAIVRVGTADRNVAKGYANAASYGLPDFSSQRQIKTDQVTVNDHDFGLFVGQDQGRSQQWGLDPDRSFNATHRPLHPETNGRRNIDPRHPGGKRKIAHVFLQRDSDRFYRELDDNKFSTGKSNFGFGVKKVHIFDG